MEHFIIVFSECDKSTLIDMGYVLIKSDERNHIYTFENSGDLHFDRNTIHAVFSDILTF